MTGYHQLTQEQRYQIYALMKAGFNYTQTASKIGVRKSTVSREVRRNQGRRGYRPGQAQELAAARLERRERARIPTETWQRVELLSRREWCPAQVAGRLNHRPRKTLGYKTPNEVFFKQPLVALTT